MTPQEIEAANEIARLREELATSQGIRVRLDMEYHAEKSRAEALAKKVNELEYNQAPLADFLNTLARETGGITEAKLGEDLRRIAGDIVCRERSNANALAKELEEVKAKLEVASRIPSYFGVTKTDLGKEIVGLRDLLCKERARAETAEKSLDQARAERDETRALYVKDVAAAERALSEERQKVAEQSEVIIELGAKLNATRAREEDAEKALDRLLEVLPARSRFRAIIEEARKK